MAPKEPPVRLSRLRDEMTEARFVVEEIVSSVRRREAKLSDFAVLFRTQTQPRAFEAEMRSAGVPYVLVGGMSFFDRKEVRDILAFLKLVVNPRDETALLRVINTPPQGIGKTTVERALVAATEAGRPLADMLESGEVDGWSQQALEGYRTLSHALSGSALARERKLGRLVGARG